ncbi:MAG: hypothetical protein K5859_08120 [Atopobiaceae bacterium]|nr:hypothetical protein [Atopobiaceae bacterium]
MPDTNALTDDERTELEALRAEKAKREQAQAAAAERAELEALKAEAARTKSEAEHDRAIAEARERGRKMMEPDEDDLAMPIGQKIVIFAVVGIAIVFILMTVFGK